MGKEKRQELGWKRGGYQECYFLYSKDLRPLDKSANVPLFGYDN